MSGIVRVNRLFIGDSLNRGSVTATNTLKKLAEVTTNIGEIGILNCSNYAVENIAAIANPLVGKFRLFQKSNEGVFMSDEIQLGSSEIVSSKSVVGALPTVQLTQFDPGATAPTLKIGETYIVKIRYTHNKEIFGDKIPNVWFYTHTATTTAWVDLVDAIVSKINADKHIRNQVTATKESTDHLQIAGKDYMVTFEVNLTDSEGNVVLAPTAIQTATIGKGNGKEIRRQEEYNLNYRGISNRYAWPTAGDLGTERYYADPNCIYHAISIGFNDTGISTDPAKVVQIHPKSVTIYVKNQNSSISGGLLGTAPANIADLVTALGL